MKEDFDVCMMGDIVATKPMDTVLIQEKVKLCDANSREAVVNREKSAKLIEHIEFYSLTVREGDVLIEIINGHSIKEIAESLFITERTVKYHISNILSKTKCKNQRMLLAKLKFNCE